MAINANAYSPKEWRVGIAYEDTVGTAETEGFISLDVDSVDMPSLNPNQVAEVKSGAGRTAKKVDFFQSNKATVKEISVSGTVWDDAVGSLLTNITGDTASAFDVAYNYSPVAIAHADNLVADFTKTFTMVVVSPLTNSTMVFAGCVCTALSLSGDMGTESGRVKYSATIKTGYKPSLSASDPTISTLYSAGNQRFMTEFTTLKTVHGIADCVVNSFTLNLENDAVILGYQGDNGEPEVINRASEFVANLDCQIKYDSSTEPLITTFETQESGVTANTALTGTSIGATLPYSVLTNVALASGDVSMLDVSVKALAHTEGNLVSVILA